MLLCTDSIWYIVQLLLYNGMASVKILFYLIAHVIFVYITLELSCHKSVKIAF